MKPILLFSILWFLSLSCVRDSVPIDTIPPPEIEPSLTIEEGYSVRWDDGSTSGVPRGTLEDR